jgi:hypothetical protein
LCIGIEKQKRKQKTKGSTEQRSTKQFLSITAMQSKNLFSSNAEVWQNA